MEFSFEVLIINQRVITDLRGKGWLLIKRKKKISELDKTYKYVYLSLWSTGKHKPKEVIGFVLQKFQVHTTSNMLMK